MFELFNWIKRKIWLIRNRGFIEELHRAVETTKKLESLQCEDISYVDRILKEFN